MLLLHPINQKYDVVASRMQQPGLSSPLEPWLHQDTWRRSSSLTSAEPLTLYLLMSSFHLSLADVLVTDHLRPLSEPESSYRTVFVRRVSLLSMVTLATEVITISLAVFNPSFNLSFLFFFNQYSSSTPRLCCKKPFCLSVCSGRSDDHCSARRQQLCPDR